MKSMAWKPWGGCVLEKHGYPASCWRSGDLDKERVWCWTPILLHPHTWLQHNHNEDVQLSLLRQIHQQDAEKLDAPWCRFRSKAQGWLGSEI